MKVRYYSWQKTVYIHFQDPVSKNWWLYVNNVDIGYFPVELFSGMNSADEVGWGGTTSTPQDSSSPPIGYGHFPDRKFFHSCYFIRMSYMNISKKNNEPKKHQIKKYIDNPECFGLSYYGNLHKSVDYSIQFGGPGGSCSNWSVTF